MRRFIPAALAFIAAAALQVSGFQDTRLAIGLGFLLLGLAVFGAWPWLHGIGGPALVVTIKRETWSNYQYKARILEALVRIENTTGERRQLTLFQVSGRPFAAGVADPEILREVEARRNRLQRLNAAAFIDPHQHVEGWVVHAFAHAAEPGEPNFQFSVYDEHNNAYLASRRRGGWPF